MTKDLDVVKIAEKISRDTRLFNDLLMQGETLFSPHPTKASFLIKYRIIGKEIGVLKERKFVPANDEL